MRRQAKGGTRGVESSAASTIAAAIVRSVTVICITVLIVADRLPVAWGTFILLEAAGFGPLRVARRYASLLGYLSKVIDGWESKHGPRGEHDPFDDPGPPAPPSR